MTNVEKIYPDQTMARLLLGARIKKRFWPLRSYVKHFDAIEAYAETQLEAEIAMLLDRPDEIDDETFDALDFEERAHIREFSKLQCISISTMACSSFERCLNDFCRMVPNPTKLELRDLQGRGIRRAEIFLRRVCHVSEPFDGEDWRDALRIFEARNHWVHAGEFLSKDEEGESIRKVLRHDLPGLKQESFESDSSIYELVPAKDFCTFSLNKFEALSWSILGSMTI